MGARFLYPTPSGPCPGPVLESPINGFQSFQCIEQLQARLACLICAWNELFRVPDRESDPVDCDPCLVSHFEFDGRRPRIHSIFYGLKNLTHDF